MQTLDRAPLRPHAPQDLIRLGPPKDGGYVLPASLVGRTTLLLAAGIKQDWSFERHFVRMGARVRVIGIDPTVGPALFARQIAAGLAALVRAVLRGDRRAIRRQLAAVRGSVDYFVFFGLRHRHVRRFLAGRDGPDEVSLQWLLDRAGVGREHTVFLKMDIEGAEYGVVPDIVRLGRWINGVIIEFHRVGRKARAFNEAIAQLRQHFEVVHVHGNNYGGYDQRSGFPDAVEVTLVHRSLLPGPLPPSTHDYPVAGLDFPNRPGRPDHPLRFD